jgi:TM2 domain-containing membrane protein YozV
MTGKVLDFSTADSSGVISGDDGVRYSFAGAEWRDRLPPARGMAVDFELRGSSAVGIYRALSRTGGTSVGWSSPKNKITAGLLAIFLGGLGAHKFYLGYTIPALVFLLTNTIGLVLTIWVVLLPNIALGVVATIEGILYLTMSDDEFYEKHVVGRREWF